MTASEIFGGDEGVASSPRSRVKFLCSYGGKILPRPGDFSLKYVGGETRVVAVPRDIKFSELMKKLNAMVEVDMILKYQVIPEDLDALVTVKSDEDLKHMVDEYRRLESEGIPKLRAFLFPSSPLVLENQMNPLDPCAIEQRYIEAVNGIIRPSPNTSGRLTPVNGNRSNFSISACSSPKSASPDGGRIIDSLPLEPPMLNGYRPNKLTLPKVRSSPSLYNLSSPPHPKSSNNHCNHQVYQPHYFYHQNHQQPYPYRVQSPRPPQDYLTEKPPAPGPYDFGRGPMGHGHIPINHVYSIGRHDLGNGYSKCGCGCYNESLVYTSGGLSKRGSLPTGGKLDRPDSTRNHMWE